MCASQALMAARQFLQAVTEGPPPAEAEVLRALDRLLAAVHDVAAMAPDGTADGPPPGDWRARYGRIGQRFPGLGLYPVCDPTDLPGAAACLVGDAIDDLADIAADMEQVVWLADTAGEAAALSVFCQLYSHWGRHARDLAGLLHARCTAGG